MWPRESRFSRRILGDSFREFLADSTEHPLARMMKTPSGVVYVFLAHPRDSERSHRQRELLLRCVVARGLNQDSTTAVGIATEQCSPGGHSTDLAICHLEDWSQEAEQFMRGIQQDLGYFKDSAQTKQSCDEYPGTGR